MIFTDHDSRSPPWALTALNMLESLIVLTISCLDDCFDDCLGDPPPWTLTALNMLEYCLDKLKRRSWKKANIFISFSSFSLHGESFRTPGKMLFPFTKRHKKISKTFSCLPVSFNETAICKQLFLLLLFLCGTCSIGATFFSSICCSGWDESYNCSARTQQSLFTITRCFHSLHWG